MNLIWKSSLVGLQVFCCCKSDLRVSFSLSEAALSLSSLLLHKMFHRTSPKSRPASKNAKRSCHHCFVFVRNRTWSIGCISSAAAGMSGVVPISITIWPYPACLIYIHWSSPPKASLPIDTCWWVHPSHPQQQLLTADSMMAPCPKLLPQQQKAGGWFCWDESNPSMGLLHTSPEVQLHQTAGMQLSNTCLIISAVKKQESAALLGEKGQGIFSSASLTPFNCEASQNKSRVSLCCHSLLGLNHCHASDSCYWQATSKGNLLLTPISNPLPEQVTECSGLHSSSSCASLLDQKLPWSLFPFTDCLQYLRPPFLSTHLNKMDQ